MMVVPAEIASKFSSCFRQCGCRSSARIGRRIASRIETRGASCAAAEQCVVVGDWVWGARSDALTVADDQQHHCTDWLL